MRFASDRWGAFSARPASAAFAIGCMQWHSSATPVVWRPAKTPGRCEGGRKAEKIGYTVPMRVPVVAIVGRPNVGKSTLFNRLARRRISIVEDVPGVTRDRIYADGVFEDIRYTLIDTGGFEPDPDTQLFEEIRTQSQLAIEEADVVLMVVDARAGPTPPDIEVARLLRKSGRPLLLAANKVDGPKHDALAHEFYEIGADQVFAISAEHGRGVGDMMEGLFEHLDPALAEAGRAAQEAWEKEQQGDLSEDEIDDALDEAEGLAEGDVDDDDGAAYDDEYGLDDGDEGFGEPADEPPPVKKSPVIQMPEVLRLCVIGKPNSGKSSLVNRLLGEERHLVSDIAGTTMDAVDSFFEYGGHKFRIIDTAGIRRKRSISAKMEKYAVVSALKGLDRADVAIMMIDATAGLTEQDMKVAAFAHDKGRALLIVVNKWDLKKEHELDAKEFREMLRDRMPFVDYAPILFASAKTGRKVFDIVERAVEVARAHFTRVPTADVNRVITAAVAAHQPPVHKGKRVKIYFGAQVRAAPPTFVFATNDVPGVHFSYRRFLQNRLREAFGFEGAPIRLILRRKGDAKGREKNIEARKRRQATQGKKGRKKGPRRRR